jgi:hypothetical protein
MQPLCGWIATYLPTDLHWLGFLMFLFFFIIVQPRTMTITMTMTMTMTRIWGESSIERAIPPPHERLRM